MAAGAIGEFIIGVSAIGETTSEAGGEGIGDFIIGISAIEGGGGDLDAYVRLITSEHIVRSLFVATVALTVRPYLDTQALTLSLPDAFSVDRAVGVQLDAVGMWVGLSRYVALPLTDVFFAWDTTGLGWDQGYWQGADNPFTSLSVLDDDTYRVAIKAKIIANTWNGTLAQAMEALNTLFSETTTPGTHILIQDGMDMSMTFAITGTLPSAVLRQLFANGVLGLKPAGVRANYVMTSTDGTPIFGWDMTTGLVVGWDSGGWDTNILQ